MRRHLITCRAFLLVYIRIHMVGLLKTVLCFGRAYTNACCLKGLSFVSIFARRILRVTLLIDCFNRLIKLSCPVMIFS